MVSLHPIIVYTGVQSPNNCNSLLYGLPKYHISKLQQVQNAAARLVMNTKKYDHITFTGYLCFTAFILKF